MLFLFFLFSVSAFSFLFPSQNFSSPQFSFFFFLPRIPIRLAHALFPYFWLTSLVLSYKLSAVLVIGHPVVACRLCHVLNQYSKMPCASNYTFPSGPKADNQPLLWKTSSRLSRNITIHAIIVTSLCVGRSPINRPVVFINGYIQQQKQRNTQHRDTVTVSQLIQHPHIFSFLKFYCFKTK